MLPIFDVLNGTYVNITGFQMLQHEKLPPEISTVGLNNYYSILDHNNLLNSFNIGNF